MKIEDQCCSLELAKRLKELGIKQKSLFYWIYGDVLFGETYLNKKARQVCNLKPDAISAFTVAELGEMLPLGWATWRYSRGWHGDRTDKSDVDYALFSEKAADTEADARAKMLIYLLEQKLVTP